MAGDWIKVLKETPDKPEIALAAKALHITHSKAFLQWFRLYCWADSMTSTGEIPYLSFEEVDRLSRCCPGTSGTFSGQNIGWITPLDGDWTNGLLFKNWHKHNGSSAKARAYDAEKKRLQRLLSRFCPENSGTESGPEKRRVIRDETRRDETALVSLVLETNSTVGGSGGESEISEKIRILAKRWNGLGLHARPEDRDLVMKICALVAEGKISVDAAEQAREAVVIKKPKRPGAYLTACLKKKYPDFAALLAMVKYE